MPKHQYLHHMVTFMDLLHSIFCVTSKLISFMSMAPASKKSIRLRLLLSVYCWITMPRPYVWRIGSKGATGLVSDFLVVLLDNNLHPRQLSDLTLMKDQLLPGELSDRCKICVVHGTVDEKISAMDRASPWASLTASGQPLFAALPLLYPLTMIMSWMLCN